MSQASALFEGWVRHRRMEPEAHQFRFPLFMMYLDLAELPAIFSHHWAWSEQGAALARFRRSDYFGDPGNDLANEVRDAVARVTGQRPLGPIRLLTHLRYFGYLINPISIYYCFNQEERLESLLLEVTNTPWGERHTYILPAADAIPVPSAELALTPKQLHVSPFLPMDINYRFLLPTPTERIVAHIQCWRDQTMSLDATLHLKRVEITRASLSRSLWRYPFMTCQVVAAIHWQALRLWLKGVPLFNHPLNQQERPA